MIRRYRYIIIGLRIFQRIKSPYISFFDRKKISRRDHWKIMGGNSLPRKISSNIGNSNFRKESQITPNLPNISRRHNIPTRTQHYLIITSPKQPIHNTIIIISNPLNRHVTTSKLTSVETPNPPETPLRSLPSAIQGDRLHATALPT